MQSLNILSSQFTPGVFLDADTGVFNFGGFSLPENAEEFFKPIYIWLEDYSQLVTEKLDLPEFKAEFKLDYFNTATLRSLLHIHSLLYHISQIHKVLVYWYIDIDDLSMFESVDEIADLTQMPIQIIKVDNV
jgi:hypothetical protein